MSMWRQIAERLRDFPARLKVVRLMIEYGIGLREDGRIVVGPIEIPDTSLARAAGVDRRVVKRTVEQLLQDPSLRKIFTGLKPAGAFLAPIAKELGYSVLEIRADPRAPGILAAAAQAAAEHGISVRQAVAEDPELFPEPKLTLVLERPLPGDALHKLLRLPHVRSVTTY